VAKYIAQGLDVDLPRDNIDPLSASTNADSGLDLQQWLPYGPQNGDVELKTTPASFS
jgi:hypothetical protein